MPVSHTLTNPLQSMYRCNNLPFKVSLCYPPSQCLIAANITLLEELPEHLRFEAFAHFIFCITFPPTLTHNLLFTPKSLSHPSSLPTSLLLFTVCVPPTLVDVICPEGNIFWNLLLCSVACPWV